MAARTSLSDTARSLTDAKVRPESSALPTQASFCRAEALSVRTSIALSTTVFSGSAAGFPGQVKPMTVTRAPARRKAAMIAALAIS